jgi:CheY-like chemotaxis protein
MGQGTGLGLSVSLGIAQQHGGTITAANRDPREGSGARFTLRIPRGTLPVTPPVPDHSSAAHRAEPRRVLIIDDEGTIRRALARFYTRRGWIATEAENGARALQRLVDASEDFDLIISDVKMPDVSGIELHAALQAFRPEILDRLVFCTGEMQSPAVAAFFARTGCRVLLKPFDLKTLADLSDEIVRTGRSASPIPPA